MDLHLSRLQKARVALLLDEPFFGSLLMHLKPVVDRTRKTFNTDGRILGFNPEYMDKLTEPQLKTVLAHEVLHCALLHPFRRGQRDHRKFNKAADYAINNFLDRYNQEAVGRKQPEPFPLKDIGLLLDHTYDNLSAEEIYSRLQDPPNNGGGGKQPPNQQQSQGAGGQGGRPQGPQPGQGGSPSGSPPPNGPHEVGPGEFSDGAIDEAERDVSEAQWKIALQQAALAAKSQGRLPGGVERVVKEFIDPAVPWTEVLRSFLTSTANDDYSWSRPNRRYAGSGLILPSMRSPHLGPVIVAIDTSGSIDQKQFDTFISEARAILFDCRPDKFILAQCDARLQAWQELDPFEEIKITFKGGGGTSFRPVFERALEFASAEAPPAALIYLTDLEGTFPKDAPPFPVLWASISKKSAPWGETLRL